MSLNNIVSERFPIVSILGRSILLIGIAFFAMNLSVYGQNCSTCTGVTAFTVDISAKPDTSWTINSGRNGQCCQGSGSDKCIVFYVTVHPSATEIMFVYRNGSANNGSYQINCTGTAVAPGTPMCLSGLTTFCITYCNPGNSSDDYTITTSSGFSAGNNITLRSGCTGILSVTGLVESSLTWNSVYPGVAGAYNSYLSCTAGCDSTNITPAAGAPAYVDYKVCGSRTGCSLGTYCDTQRVYMTPVMAVNITPVNPVICAGGSNQTLTANVTGGAPPYAYMWNTGATTQSISASAGTYTVTVSDTAVACPSINSNVSVASVAASTANAGTDATICSGSGITLSGSFGGSATASVWTTSGTGTFNDATLTNATYTPSAADIAAGSVTLTLTASGPCPSVNDAMILTIDPAAIVSAATDAAICAGNSYPLSGSFGGSASSIIWTTSGTGTFDNATSPTATYTPSPADIAGGTVTITITTNDPSGPCGIVSDAMVLTIDPAPSVNAGSDASICSGSSYTLSGSFGGSAASASWSTSGSGTFDNTSLLTATYTPSAADIALGLISLSITTNNPAGPCTAVSDAMILTINPAATVSASSDALICAGSSYTLSGLSGGSASSTTWTTSGTGTFDNSSLLTATYIPSLADVASGSVTLTITTDDPAGPCVAVSDDMVLTINPAATVSASTDATICSDNSYTLSGTRGGSATQSTWTSSGTGIFDDATLLNAAYTPSAADISAGTVTLTITTDDPAGPCPAVSDAMTLTINPAATVNAGSDATICAGSLITLSGTRGGSASSSSWTSSGTGTFDNATLLSATYTPSAGDITAGIVQLTITTDDPTGACIWVSDVMNLTIDPVPTVSAGSDATICANSVYTLQGSLGGGALTSTWTTSGSGTFDNATSATAIYTPSSADITAGMVTLTITTDDPAGPCVAVNDNMVLTINPVATVNAGSDVTICSGSTYTLSGTRGGSAVASTWTTSGTGTFDNATLLAATYTPSATDNTSGTVTLTLTTNDPAGPCSAVNDIMIITINPAATVSAGSDVTICSGSTITLSGIRGGSATTSTWTTSGTGSFNNAALLNAIYTPSATDISNGTVTLTITTDDPAGSCTSVTDEMILTINPAATVNAGSNVTICAGSNYTLAGTRGGGATTSTWTTSGTGTFNDATSLTPTYTPSAADIASGSITLTITTNDPAGPCPAVSDAMVITINQAATANAGSDATICSGDTHTLSGTRGGSATSSIWNSSGTGTFDDASQLTATYTPSIADISAGTVTLTITTNNPAGVCPAVTDAMILTINPAATVNAGIDATICSGFSYTLSGNRGGGATSSTWISSGTGIFNNASLLNAIYTPSAADIAAGSVTLTISTNDPSGPCVSVNDAMVLTINLSATANAGIDATICSGTNYTLSGTRGGSAVSSTWATSGTGTFNDATQLNAIYTPSVADISSGFVTLTITTDDPAGTCTAASDAMVLTINPAATVNAGSDATICSGFTYNLAGTRGGGATSSTWTTSGTGTFNNALSLNAIYTPSAADISSGSVTLTITTNDPAGPCSATSDAMVLTINPAATVNAGNDATICSGSNYTLSGSRGGSATSSTWTTSGSGTFNNAGSLSATYTPSATDITSGSVTLTITTDDPAGPCAAGSDAMVLTINQAATVNAGIDASICSGSNYTLSATRGGSATSTSWVTSGTGTFNNATALNAVYTPSAADISSGTLTLTITTNNPAGVCPAVSDSMILNIDMAATVNAGTDDGICSGTSYALTGIRGGSATSSIWTTSGTGVFDDATLINATYTPSAADLLSGSVTLTITTNDPVGTCTAATDAMILIINSTTTASAGSDADICSGSTYNLSGTRGGSATSSTWTTSGTGIFDNAASLTAIYTPSAADIAAGSVTITITTNDPPGICSAATDEMILTIQPVATVNAGSDVTICSGSSITLSGSRGGSASSSVWSTSGSGTFDNATLLNAMYVPSAADITSGTVTLSITTNDPPGVCSAASDILVLTINPAATINAGNDTSICAGSPYTLSATRGGGATSTTWSTSGTGSFSNPSLLNAVYTPSAADISSGIVTLTITTNDPAGPCASANDAMQLTINPIATVNAGTDATICSGSNYTLSGSLGGSASTSTWSSSGSGTFTNASLVNAVYTPSAADISSGTVTLTITTNDPVGPCPAVSDAMVLMINPAATVNAGADATICSGSNYTLSGIRGGGATTSTWTTSGTGNFNNATLLIAIYTPSAADISTGAVTLTLTTNDPAGPCPAVNDEITLTINTAATVNAGSDGNICSGNSFTVSGTRGGSATSSIWTTSGTGTFADATSLATIYFPSAADEISGSVNLILTTDDPPGLCPAVSDLLTLTINQGAVVSAGIDASACAGSTFTLSGTRGGSATSSAWTTSGTGTFNNATFLNAIYTPSASDISAGLVNLTITTNDPSGICPAASDVMELTIDPVATVNAGIDATICSGNNYTLNGTRGGSATSSTWTTSGSGTFDDATALNAIYTPSATDITNGSVIISLTTNDPIGPCPAVGDNMLLSINPAAVVNAGADAVICSGSSYVMAGTRSGSATASIWTSSGTGVFSNATALLATYTPSAADIITGSVILTITSNDPAGPCNSVADSMILTINQAATTNAGSDATICSGSSQLLSGTIGGSATTITWTTSGSGNFNAVNQLNSEYFPSAADISAGTVKLIITTDNPSGICPAVSDTMNLTINPVATVSAGSDVIICSGSNYTLSATRGGSASTSSWTSSGSGTFNDATQLNATYIPSAGDITSASVTLTITTNDPTGPCTSVSDEMIITINPNAVVNAGTDITICSGTSYQLSGTSGGSTSTITWTSSGTGTFDDVTSPGAVYTPSASDITSGGVTLIITTDDPAGICPAVSDSMSLMINPAAIVNAGSDTTICSGNSYTLSGIRGGSASTSSWTTSGTGSFDNVTLLNPVYTPSSADIASGMVILTITSNDPVGICSFVSDDMILNINPAAIVSAGNDLTICSGNTVTLSGTTGGSATASLWSTTGSGIFDDAALMNAQYTPSAADIASGAVTLIITTNNPAGVCPAVIDSMTLVINPAAIASAGSDTSLCSGSSLTLSGVRGGSATSSIWTTSGTGTFNNSTLLNAIYNPSLADLLSGSVVLTLTTNDPMGVCPAVSDQMSLFIYQGATAGAGNDASICAGTSYTLSGTRGGSALSSTWTTSGTGTFDDASTLNAIYTPSASDILAGSVILTITTDDPVGPCPAMTDEIVLTINGTSAAFNYAASDYCQAASDPVAVITGTPGGTFNGPVEIIFSNQSTGQIDLSASIAGGPYIISYTSPGSCPVTADFSITINTEDDPSFYYSSGTFCQTGSNPFPTITGTGGGIFSGPPQITFQNTGTGAIDLMASSAGGPYSITYTTTGICPHNSSIGITIASGFDASFGYTGQTFCKSDANPIPAFTYPASPGIFTATPPGLTFVNVNTGEINLSTSTEGTYVITNDIPASGGCPGVWATDTITINNNAVVSAGFNATICQGDSYILLGNMSGSASNITWTTNGTGAFDDINSLNASYTPSAADMIAGNVILTITSDDPDGNGPCSNAISNMILTINVPPLVDAGADASICEGSSYTLTGTRGGSASSSVWTTTGSGTFNSSTSLTPVYTPSNNDIIAGFVTLSLTSDDPVGPCSAVSDSMVLTITGQAFATAGNNAIICDDDSYTLSGSISGSASALIWSTDGTGTFDDTTIANATYFPSSADILSGTVVLTLSTNDPDGTGPCTAATSSLLLTINPSSIVNAGADNSVCEGTPYTLTGSMSGGASSITWSTSGTGTFDNANLINAKYYPSPADLSSGMVTLTITSNDPMGPCAATDDSMQLTLSSMATVDAGPDVTICQGSDVSLAGVFGGSASTATWSTGGTGIFDDVTSPNATYTPSVADIQSGGVLLTFTTNDPDGNGPCSAQSSSMLLIINPAAVVNAGNDTTICSGTPLVMAGNISGDVTTITWATNGTGIFDNNQSLIATYYPSSTDITAGSVILSITSNDPNGPCQSVSDSMTLLINPGATANAGSDITICSGSSYLLSGSIGGSATSAGWSTSGTGNFDDATILNATYTPSVDDSIAGFVILSLTTNDPDNTGPCTTAIDQIVITISPTGNADFNYASVEFCSDEQNPIPTITGNQGGIFTESSGNIVFIDATTGEIDLVASTIGGPYTITYTTSGICTGMSSFDVTINAIDDPSFSFSSGTFCHTAANPVPTVSGTPGGLFTSSNGNIIIDASTGEIDLSASLVGTYYITYTTPGYCSRSLSVPVTITDSPDASFSLAAAYCQGDPDPLPVFPVGSSAGIFSAIPSGINFANANTGQIDLTTSTPGTYDIINFIAASGGCDSSIATATVTINPMAIVMAGPSDTICAGATVTLSATFSGSATGVTWMSMGTGSFDNDTSLNPVYTPSTSDISNGFIQFYVQSNDPDGTGPCINATDSVIIYITPAIFADAGTDQNICNNQPFVNLNGNINGGNSSVIWTTSGSGSFIPDASTLNASYYFSSADSTSGNITLVLNASTVNSCSISTDTVIITMTPVSVVFAGNDTTISSGNVNVPLDGLISGGMTTGYWTTSGSGSFIPNDSTLNSVYQLSPADILSGSVMLILSPNTSCTTGADTLFITVSNTTIFVNAGNDQFICEGDIINLTGSVINATGGIWTTSGNGSFSPDDTSLNVVYTPTPADISAGSVSIYLTSTGNGFNQAITDTIVVNLFSRPLASFSQLINCDYSVAFTDSSTVNNDSIVSWNWQFGDGNSDSSQNPTHIYSGPGTYLITLVATSSGGCSDTVSNTIIVSSLPVPAFSSISNCQSDSVYFTDISSISTGTIISWNWNFGDGNNSTIQNPIHIYTSSGTYNVTLAVTSNSGCSVSMNTDITIAPNPVAAFTILTNCSDTVSFTDVSTITGDSIISWNWSFGDGNNSSQQNPIHNYSGAGTYTTTLIVSSSNGCSDSFTQAITVIPRPVASFNVNANCLPSGTDFFDNSTILSGNIVSWFWTLGDGTTSTLQNPSHLYPNTGTYLVTLTVTSDSGCTAAYSDSVIVMSSPQAYFTYTSNCSNLVSFADSSLTSGGSNIAWNWNFGDGNSATVQNPAHSYLNPGTYNVTLVTTNSAGCSDTLTIALAVDWIIADYSPGGGTYSINEPINFNNLTNGTASWQWIFGDGVLTSLENPIHSFSQPGTYSVIMIISTLQGCSDTVFYNFEILDEIVNNFGGPVAVPSAFTPDGDGNNDILSVKGGPILKMDFRVFNEWGNELFRSNNQNIGWDGTYKGQKQPMGTYIWTLIGTTSNNKEIKLKGDITILK